MSASVCSKTAEIKHFSMFRHSLTLNTVECLTPGAATGLVGTQLQSWEEKSAGYSLPPHLKPLPGTEPLTFRNTSPTL